MEFSVSAVTVLQMGEDMLAEEAGDCFYYNEEM